MAARILTTSLIAAALLAAAPARLAAQEPRVTRDSAGVSIDFVNTDLRAAVQALSGYLDRPVIFGNLASQAITLRTPRPVPPDQVAALLRNLLASQGMEMADEGGAYVIRAKAVAPPPQPVAPPSARSAPGGPTELFVIRLRHARASDVAQVVSALYGRASALGELGASRGGTLGDELRANRSAAYGAETGAAAAPRRTGGFEGEVQIVPDSRTNSLLVRATRADFELIREAVAQVDVRPLQVLIQATIAEVRRNSDFSIGLSAVLHPHPLKDGDGTIEAETKGLAATDLTVDVLGLELGSTRIDLALSAGESRGAVSILSRPLIFAANNEEAEIVVGDQLPFVQVQRSTDGGVLDEIVQYKDVGTRLFVVPTISADGYVQLQVTQEINNATGSRGVNGAPELSTRSVRTALLVGDGQTVVLGGLASRQRDRASSGVPFLSRIPVLGWIFGSKSHRSDDKELFIFLTPRIIRSDEELRSATEDVQQNGGRAAEMPRKAPSFLHEPEKKPAKAAPPDSVPPRPPLPQSDAGAGSGEGMPNL